MKRCVWYSFLMFMPCFGQTSNQDTDAAVTTQLKRDNQLSSYSLDFRPSGTVSGLKAAPAFLLPFQCPGDGTVFINTLDPSESATVLYSIRDKKAVRITLGTLPDFHDISIIDYFPTWDQVALLIHATKVETTAPRRDGTMHEFANANAGSSYFIAKLDRTGNYKGSVQLQTGSSLSRLAVFPSGEILVAGYDVPSDQQKISLLDQSGKIIRYVDQPMTATETHAGGYAANPTLFVASGQNIVAWRSGTRDQVLDISAKGLVREVSITLPAGVSLADLVPSDDLWLVHVNSTTSSPNSARNMSDMSYYEVQPLDGSLTRELRFSDASVGMIACKSKQEFVSYAVDKEGNLIEFLAR